jgi:hypothetical protein
LGYHQAVDVDRFRQPTAIPVLDKLRAISYKPISA